MDTTRLLTATEVIDRVRARPHRRARSGGRAAPAGRRLGVAAPLPEPTSGRAHWGDPRLDEQVIPLAGPGAPLVAEFAPAELAAALGITLDAAEAADRRRPRADLPPPAPLGAGPRRAGAGLAGPARSPGRPTTSAPTRSRSPTGSSPRPRTRSASSTPPGWSTRPGSTSTPTARSPRRNTQLARSAASGSGTPANPATTDVVMTLDTPDAELFDQTIGRIAADLRRPRRHRRPRRPPGQGGRDPRRPPVRPGPHLRPRGRRHPRTGRPGR